MKKTFQLQDLECANCAAKMEDALWKMDGVQSAQVNFMRQTLTLEAADEQFESIVKKAGKLVRKIEPDVRIVG